jgi:type IV pilus assembly protein PilW
MERRALVAHSIDAVRVENDAMSRQFIESVGKEAAGSRPVPARCAPALANRGMSLIEILVALAIAAVLLLGLGQIFVGSKNVYRLQEGMSRVQENARFVLQYLESNVRMAGYLGCGNDADLTVKPGSPPAFLNHLRQPTSAPGVFPVDQDNLLTRERFQRPIEAYAYTGGSVDNLNLTLGAVGDWTPNLPPDLGVILAGINMPAKGSDVLVLRLVGSESTPLLGDFDMLNGSFNVADPDLVKGGQIYAITNCSNARIFKASPRAAGSNPVLALAADNLLSLVAGSGSTWTGTFANVQFNQTSTQLNAEVHPAQFIVLYVGIRDPGTASATPVLKIADGVNPPQELADDVEIMKLWFGVDTDGDRAVDKYVAANSTDADANLAVTTIKQRDINWRNVLSVRIGFLMRSQDIANATPHTGDAAGDNVYRLFDARVQRPRDSRFRDVYTTTVALRNRLPN